MYFLVIGHDSTDPEAGERRAAARGEHLELVKKMVADGEMVTGGALLGDDGKPIGSAVFVSFPSRTELDAWLAREPYVQRKIWARVDVTPATLAMNGGKLLV